MWFEQGFPASPDTACNNRLPTAVDITLFQYKNSKLHVLFNPSYSTYVYTSSPIVMWIVKISPSECWTGRRSLRPFPHPRCNYHIFGTKGPAIGFYTTSLAASAFRLDDRGSVKTGLRADLLLLERDPTVDITDTNVRAL